MSPGAVPESSGKISFPTGRSVMRRIGFFCSCTSPYLSEPLIELPTGSVHLGIDGGQLLAGKFPNNVFNCICAAMVANDHPVFFQNKYSAGCPGVTIKHSAG